MKLPAYGLHFWLPKAHVEAPTGGRIILAGVILKLGTYGILSYGRVSLVGGAGLLVSVLVWGAGLGAVAMFCQPDLKGVAAYSSVVHIRLATAALLRSSPLGAKAGLLVALGHGFRSSALFCWVGAAQRRRLSRNPFFVTGLRSLGRGAFLISFCIFFASNGTPRSFRFGVKWLPYSAWG